MKLLLDSKNWQPCQQHRDKKIHLQFFKIWNFFEWVLGLSLAGLAKAGTQHQLEKEVCPRKHTEHSSTWKMQDVKGIIQEVPMDVLKIKASTSGRNI